MTRVYKIVDRSAWETARVAGRFDGSAVDLADGYIHLSTAAQASETARRHFAGQDDLVVLAVDADQLVPDLRWEPSRGGDLFPHLYAPLLADHVVAVWPAPLGVDGVPRLPQFLTDKVPS